MYIFGGRTDDGNDLGDLAAFRISTRRWYTFQNMGPSPSPRSGHSMTAYGKNVVVLAGEPSSETGVAPDLSSVYVLDTSKIRYPNDQSPSNMSGMVRARGNSAGEKSGMQPSRAIMSPKDNTLTNGQGPRRLDGILEKQVSDANNMTRQIGGSADAGSLPNNTATNVSNPQAGPGSPAYQQMRGQMSGASKDMQAPATATPQNAAARQTVSPTTTESLRPAPTKGSTPLLNTNLRNPSRDREPLSDARNRSLSPIKDSPIMKDGSNLNGRKLSTPAVTKIVPRQEEQPPVVDVLPPTSAANTRQTRGRASVDSTSEMPLKPRPTSRHRHSPSKRQDHPRPTHSCQSNTISHKSRSRSSRDGFRC